jgi:hypothetical protein
VKLLDQVEEVLAEHKKPAHVDRIAELLIIKFPNLSIPLSELPSKLSSALSIDVKKKNGKARFSKVKNNKGGFKRGVYRLRTRPKVIPEIPSAPSVSSQYTGKAGEHAVISELLFNGFNASAMTVDDGIDVVASKDNQYFHIQVKTANRSENGVFGFTVKKNSFKAKDSFQTFYIFVLRDRAPHRYTNDYVIFPSSQIRQLVEVGIIKDGASLSIRLNKDSRGRFILNGQQDVTISINTFSQLA